MAKLRIRYFKWRDGCPRWEPGPLLRDLGLKGQDLKDDAGNWLSFGDAIEAAQDLNKTADAGRAGTPPPKRGLPKTVRNVGAAWDRYTKSSKFLTKQVSTQKDYKRKAKFFLEGFAASRRQELESGRVIKAGESIEGFEDAPVLSIDKPIMFGFSETLAGQKGPSMALGIIAVARRLFSFCELIGWRPENSNPAFRLEMARPAPRRRLWTPAEVTALVDAADALELPSIGHASVLALHSGQRQKDVLNFPRKIVKAERIALTQFKTGAAVDVKMTPQCQARMQVALRQHRGADIVSIDDETPIIIYEATGLPYNEHTFRHKFAEVRAEATDKCPSIETAQFLDLRDTAVTRLAMSGCTKWEIASITGHDFGSIDQILKHYLVLTRDLADAGIDQLVAWMDQQRIKL